MLKFLGGVAIFAPKFPRLKEWAYAGITSPVLWRAAVHAVGSYRCPNVDVVARAVASNRASTGLPSKNWS